MLLLFCIILYISYDNFSFPFSLPSNASTPSSHRLPFSNPTDIENPFSIFPNFFVIYTCENTLVVMWGIIFNFSIMKSASVWAQVDWAYHISRRRERKLRWGRRNANKDSFLLWLCFLWSYKLVSSILSIDFFLPLSHRKERDFKYSYEFSVEST